jgi:RimJ/RimL family protein N-acetyltransferase
MTNLQRERAVACRHETGGYHGLTQERNEQRGRGQAVMASFEEWSRHTGPSKGTRMAFELQPSIEDETLRLAPLRADDFELLYAAASDPLIWEQHPNKERYRRDVFAGYFKGAIESGGAFKVIDKGSGTVIGSSRYYDLDEAQRVVAIGYTFIARSHWGGRVNRALKTLMLDHAFRFVDRVIFHVGAGNLRSRKAMEKLGGVLTGEVTMSYQGEAPHRNVVYEIDRAAWAAARRPAGPS